MKKLLFLAASLLLSTPVLLLPALADDDFTGDSGFSPQRTQRRIGDSNIFTDYSAGTGTKGRSHDSDKTYTPGGYDYRYQTEGGKQIYDRSTPHNHSEDPDTSKTNTQNYLNMTRQGRFGNGLDFTSTQLLAPQSLSGASIPSGKYSLGFPKQQSMPGGGGPWVPTIGLPTTSTGSVDLDITNGYN